MTSTIVATLPETPYKGLVPYSEEDAAFFFGRDEWRELIIDNLKAYRLTLLYGESGVGKTSVLHAGVVHDLRERGLQVVAFASWQDDPLAGLAHQVAEGSADASPLDLGAALEDRARRDGRKVYVILDQFEEYFLYHPRGDAQASFVEAFARVIARSDLRASFLISIREDALAKLDRFKGLIPNLFDNYLRIEHLTRNEAREAVLEPLGEYNRRADEKREVAIESELVKALLDEVETGKIASARAGAGLVEGVPAPATGRIETPYLQLVLTRLWDDEMRAGSRVLRLETFVRLGRANGIVSTHLDEAMRALAPAEQDVAARLFNQLVTPSGTKIAQRVGDLAKYVDRPEAEITPVLDKLSHDARIIRPVGESSYEIYHDALADPILDWRANWEEQRRRRRDRRRAAGAVGGVVVVGVIAVAFVVLWLQAQHQKHVARSRQLAADAISELVVNPEQSLRLAVAAAHASGTPQAEDALRAALGQSHLLTVIHESGPVDSAALSLDGKLVATATGTGGAQLWDATTGRRVAILQGNVERVTSAAFSRDGKLVVTASDDGLVGVWDAATGRNRTILRGFTRGQGETVPVHYATFSPDGTLVAAATGPTLFLWNVTTGVRLDLKADEDITSVAFSPDSKLVVSVSGSSASVWDTGLGRRIAVLSSGSTARLDSAAFSPDSTFVATANDDGGVEISRARGGRLVARLSGHKGPVYSVAFSPHGDRVVTAGDDRTARVWEARSGRLVSILSGHVGRVSSAAFSANGQRVVTASVDGTARVWLAGTGENVAVLRGHTGQVYGAVFSRDGTRVLTWGDDGTARIWDTGRARPSVTLHDAGLHAAFSPDGSVVAADAGIWDAKNGRRRAALGGTGGVSFSPDGKLVFTTSGAQIWRATDGRSLGGRIWEEPGASEQTAAFSPDGRLIVAATAGADERGGLNIREWTSNRVLTSLPYQGDRFFFPFTAVAVAPDGRTVAAAEGDGSIDVWPLSLLRGVTGHSGILRFQREHHLIADGIVGPQTLAALQTTRLVGHASGVESIAFSPDSRLVVTASSDGTARIWDARTGRTHVVLLGHVGAVTSAAFNAAGNLVVTTGEDATTRVWQAATGQPVTTLRVPGGRVDDAAFSPGGGRIVTASDDGTVRIYACEVCGSLDDLLTRAERRLADERTA